MIVAIVVLAIALVCLVLELVLVSRDNERLRGQLEDLQNRYVLLRNEHVGAARRAPRTLADRFKG